MQPCTNCTEVTSQLGAVIEMVRHIPITGRIVGKLLPSRKSLHIIRNQPDDLEFFRLLCWFYTALIFFLLVLMDTLACEVLLCTALSCETTSPQISKVVRIQKP